MWKEVYYSAWSWNLETSYFPVELLEFVGDVCCELVAMAVEESCYLVGGCDTDELVQGVDGEKYE